jgi:hypothetical protein
MEIDIIRSRAAKKAAQSICKFKVSALGFNREGVLVRTAMNKPYINKEGGGIHAEEQLFEVAKRLGIQTILICRIGKKGTFLPIKPCTSCSKTAKKLGIRIHTIE